MNKIITILLISVLAFGCGKPHQKPKYVIGTPPEVSKELPSIITSTNPEIPIGIVTANFKENEKPFYGYVLYTDFKNEITTISFEKNLAPQLIIPESIGAALQAIKLENFSEDLLLVNATLKDPNFNEYYLFQLEPTGWKQLTNRFAIHKTNMTDTLIPIKIDPKNRNKLLRYYSVFDLDTKEGNKYKWILLQESVDIEN